MKFFAGDNAEVLKTTIGTPGYMAPEMFENVEYDGQATDIFACGVILFLLSTGMMPYHYCGDKFHKRICKYPQKAIKNRKLDVNNDCIDLIA